MYLFISPALALVAYLLEVGCCGSRFGDRRISMTDFPWDEFSVDLRILLHKKQPFVWVNISLPWIRHGGFGMPKGFESPENQQSKCPEKSVVGGQAFQGTC